MRHKHPPSLAKKIHTFWFQPISAKGFGLMRVGWGFVGLATMLLQWQDIERFYGPEGILPRSLSHSMLRADYHFTLLEFVGTPGTLLLYSFLIAALFCVMIGLLTRWTLLLSVLLLFSFHEYGTFTLDGGDTLMRLLGFILLISPSHRTFTLHNYLKGRFGIEQRGRSLALRSSQAKGAARSQGHSLATSARAFGPQGAPPTMPIWPYRLHLWQMILLYTSSAIMKFSGGTWRSGAAVGIVLHHNHFSRFSPELADALMPIVPFITYFTLFSQLAWVLLLPLGLLSFFFRTEFITSTFKRALLICGVLVHGGIFLFMDIGTFSLAVLVSYLGLLRDEDFEAMSAFRKRWFSKRR